MNIYEGISITDREYHREWPNSQNSHWTRLTWQSVGKHHTLVFPHSVFPAIIIQQLQLAHIIHRLLWNYNMNKQKKRREHHAIIAQSQSISCSWRWNFIISVLDTEDFITNLIFLSIVPIGYSLLLSKKGVWRQWVAKRRESH